MDGNSQNRMLDLFRIGDRKRFYDPFDYNIDHLKLYEELNHMSNDMNVQELTSEFFQSLPIYEEMYKIRLLPCTFLLKYP